MGSLLLCLAEGAGVLAAPDNGSMKVTMMRHGNRVKHLGRPADQRKALIRGLVTEVIRNGAIRTTKVGLIEPANRCIQYWAQCASHKASSSTGRQW